MSHLDRLSLKVKLALAPAVCLLMLGLAAGGALWGFEQQRMALDSVISQRLPAYAFAAHFGSGLRDMNGLVNSSLGYEAMGYNEKEIAIVDQTLAKTSADLHRLLTERAGASADAQEKTTLDALAARFAKYDKAVKDTVDMKTSGPAIAATYLTTATKEYEGLLAEITRLSQSKLDDAGRDVESASQAAVQAQIGIGVATLISAGAGMVLSFVLSRGLLRRVRTLSAAVAALAQGDLTQTVARHGGDEVGQLMGDVETVRHRLAVSIDSVRQATGSVRLAAGEIAAGNADLSQRTEEQASNLQQTASSMAQLNATVKNNAETARQANQMAVMASAVAAKGGDVVGQVVATMDQISASSNKIADIISVIDGIAFQTNILALNAAVEAARAGEQGRGFAVVAGEVRNLAQRSADAAKEIKGLIHASVERVDGGSRLVMEAGQTMQEIVSQVKRVSDLIGEISSATDDQSSGIGLVGDAIGEIDRTTQQNAALVEQAAAAAESLQQQAVRLVDAVGVFRLGEDVAA